MRSALRAYALETPDPAEVRDGGQVRRLARVRDDRREMPGRADTDPVERRLEDGVDHGGQHRAVRAAGRQ